ncbi:eukaryotic cytochrome b561-domain-containing protein [Paraphysoderma sedebokerense]|nr:eukaryotic cytochrome b561-domain-containing protein [Paraphysoderma sedebokerense]
MEPGRLKKRPSANTLRSVSPDSTIATETTPLTSTSVPSSGSRSQPTIKHPRFIFLQLLSWTFLLTIVIKALTQDPEISLYTFHPVFMTLTVFFTLQSVSLLQFKVPSEMSGSGNSGSKKATQRHYTMQLFSFVTFILGFLAIFLTKQTYSESHFASTHSILGLSVLVLFLIQVGFGIAMYFFPVKVFKSHTNARKWYKAHRSAGYVGLAAFLVTLGYGVDYLATGRELKIVMWVVIGVSGLGTLVGGKLN